MKTALKRHFRIKLEKPQLFKDRKPSVEIKCSAIERAESATVVNVKIKFLPFKPQIFKELLLKQIFLPQLMHPWYKAVMVTRWQKIKM